MVFPLSFKTILLKLKDHAIYPNIVSCKSTVESTYTFQLILHMKTVWFNVDLK